MWLFHYETWSPATGIWGWQGVPPIQAVCDAPARALRDARTGRSGERSAAVSRISGAMTECGWDTLGHTCDNQAQGWFTNCSLADVPGVGTAPAPRDYLFGAVAVIPEQSFREMGPAILPNDIPIPRGGWLGLILGSGNSSLEPPSLGPRRQDRAARRGVKDQPRRCRVSAETDSSIISRASTFVESRRGDSNP